MLGIDKEEEKKSEKSVLFWPTVSGRVGSGLLWGYILYENTALEDVDGEKIRFFWQCGRVTGAGDAGTGAAGSAGAGDAV